MNSDSKSAPKKTYITTFALIMLNVVVIAGLGNDPQQAFYGLSSVTYYLIGFILFFIPTGLVAAELASGWPQRGGIFRWVGEGIGPFWAFLCISILWFQDTFNFGAGMPNFAATIMFYTTDYKKALTFVNNPKHELLIMCIFLAIFWLCTWLASRGTKVFAKFTKYSVVIGTFIPLAVMIILFFVWLAKGNKPVIPMHFKDLIPKWNGMPTLALVAGVLFSYAGIDTNSAYIKQLKHPTKQYTISVLFAGLGAFIIFVVGTLIIAMVIPKNQINIITALFVLFHDLGAVIGAPWLYLIFIYINFLAMLAFWVTDLAGPSFMLGGAGQCGYLPKWFQKHNKYGMPSRLMYFQALCATGIAFMVKLLPNVEGFFVMMTQTITILYLFYYLIMFISFIRLRYTQPNRPRDFKIPGGWFGAWLITIVGVLSCVFGIILAFYPPAQVKQEVGSATVYIVTIAILVIIVLAVAAVLYILSRHHNKSHDNDWVDKDNQFAPFTWQIEGLSHPTKTLSNIPTAVLSYGQNPLGTPIKYPIKTDLQVNVPKDYEDHLALYSEELRKNGRIDPVKMDKAKTNEKFSN